MEIIDKVLTKIELEDIKDGILKLDDIIEIADNVFENNGFIKEIEAPDLKKIGHKAFYNCHNLEKVIAKNLEIIGDYAFGRTNIKNFNFENTLEIGKYAFAWTNIEEIVLPKNLKTIGKYAFSNNPYLLKVEISSLMTKIKDGMFENCVNLKDILFSNTINKIGNSVFKNCKKLKYIKLPEHLKVIEANAFLAAENLKEVEFNLELESIGDYAFLDTKLEKVILPNSLKKIGKLPFHMCYYLEELKINRIFHNEILDETNSKLKKLIIGEKHLELSKSVKKVFNNNDLVIIRFADYSFQVVAKEIKYYDDKYFLTMFPDFEVKKLNRSDKIFNIYYWTIILNEKEIKKLNPIAFISLPPNNNIIKAFYKNHDFYDKIISKYSKLEFNSLVALIKFITIFGGLSKNKKYDIESLILSIGIKNLTKQFIDANVKTFNSKFIEIYLNLNKKYEPEEINSVMPFLYNNVSKVINSKDNNLLEEILNIQFKNEIENDNYEFDIIKTGKIVQKYDWLDNPNIENLLKGYILASSSNQNIDYNEDEKKFLTFNIKDDDGLIIATSRAYYSSMEKYLLFNSIVLSKSFINKDYDLEKTKSLIIKYVLASIEDVLNFLNEQDPVVLKVRVSLSDKSLKEQLKNKGNIIIDNSI